MSVYVFDGEMYAGWSTGRWFALAGVVALTIASLGFAYSHGYQAATLASSQMLAVFAEWAGGGLFALMAVATVGSVMISWRDRGDVEVTPEGVRRIFSPGREQFFPREAIAGFVVRPVGGVTLTDVQRRRTMEIPRSIVGYRDCIAELKAMGILRLDADRAGMATQQWKDLSWKQRIQLFGACSATIFFSRDATGTDRLVSGAICIASFSWILIDRRRNADRQRRLDLTLPVAMVLGPALWWGFVRLLTGR